MYSKLVKSVANVMYGSVGTFVWTSKKVSEGYNTVVKEGKDFHQDIKEAYNVKRAEKAIKNVAWKEQ
jgi:hypothetical protein